MENQGVNFNGTGIGTGLITSSTPVTPAAGGQFGPLKGGYALAGGGSQQTNATSASLVASYGKMTEPLRRALAQQLKSAGFKVPVTGKYSIKVRDAFISASEALSDELRGLATQDPARLASTKYDLTSFLKELATTERIGTGEDKTPTTVPSITNYRPETIADLINKVSRDLTGESATPEFISRYTRTIQSELKKPENIQQTTYYPKNAQGKAPQVTQEGFSPERFLIEEISKGDAAKASSIMGFYEVFNKAIGRDNG